MIGRRVVWRGSGWLVLALTLLASQGCSRNLIGAKSAGEAIGNYFVDRGTDFLDLGDVGFSFSSRPQFSLYANGASMGGGGFGMVDGYFLGMGGGNIGWMRHYAVDVGAILWCYEELAFGDFDKDDLATVNAQATGIAGLVTGPWGKPGWEPSCIHNIHLGWVGLVGNINFLQMIDFAAGLIGFDICGDDGYRYGLWPWQTELRISEDAASLRDQIFQMGSMPEPGAKRADTAGVYWGRGLNPMPPVEWDAPTTPAAKE